MFRFLLVALVFFCAYTQNTFAATLYMDPASTTINRGDAVTVAVRLLPDKEQGECINVVDAVVSYSDNIQPIDVSIGKSIFNIWVERPVIDKENRKITFAGGIPNGYCGRVDGDPMLTNILAEIIFRSPGMQVGQPNSGDIATIEFLPETQALLNDGLGTLAQLSTFNSSIKLEKTPGAFIADDWREFVKTDNIPPEKFSINLNKDSNGINFNGRYFIDFITSDKQTGISHYEIMEEPISKIYSFDWGGVGVPWIEGESPYVLKDQSLNSIVRVKAIDKAGNEYIATLIPEESLRTISKNEIITYSVAGSVLVLIVILIIFFFLLRKRRKNEDVKDINTDNI